MSDKKSFKVGQAPWEKQGNPKSFPVGSAPWESQQNQSPEVQERPWYSVDPKNLGAGFLKGLETIDEYTAAPVRKFVTETLTGKEFEKAPTGSEQAKMLGASDTTYKESFGVPSYLGGDISPADIYGVGLEMVQDPTVLASGALKAGKSILGMKRAAEAAKAAKALNVPQVEKELVGAFTFKAPESLEELRNWKPTQSTGQMPGRARLNQIVENVPDLETKPLKYHFDMMENPKSMKELKLKFENWPTKYSKKIAEYNQQIVQESTNKIKSTVEKFIGNEPRSISDAGNDLIESVKTKYNAEKDMLGPLFNEVQRRSPMLNPRDSQDLIVALGENTKLGKVLAQDPDTGRFILNKNTPRTGLSNQEHGVLSSVIDDLNDGMTFEEMQKTREFLRKAIDPSNPAASSEIGKVRSIMLGQMEHLAQKIDPEIGKTFKAYAINERARENIEKIIGGRIESLDAMYAANPEKIVSKVFSNPNHMQIVKEYVGQKQIDEMIGSFINSGIEKATDSAKGFSPEKFKSWLNRNDTLLSRSIEPGTHERLKSLTDYGYYGKRFLDEVNPSGTAASLKEMVEPTSFIKKVKQQGITPALRNEVVDRASDVVKWTKAKSEIDEMLGNAPSRSTLSDKSMKLGTKIEQIGRVKAGTTVGNLFNRESENKEKGAVKWANSGFDKLNKFAESKQNKQLIDVLSSLDRQDKKVQKLLIEASDFKPGSVGFQKIIDKLSQSSEKGK